MLKVLEEIASGQQVDGERLALLVDKGFEILRNAAMEVPDLEALRKRD
jgi:hypothetical protein